VNSSADTERGEAVGIPSLTTGVKAAVPKNNLAMAGGSIVGDGKQSSMPTRGQLLKKKTADNLDVGKPAAEQMHGDARSEQKSTADPNNNSKFLDLNEKQQLIFRYFMNMNFPLKSIFV